MTIEIIDIELPFDLAVKAELLKVVLWDNFGLEVSIKILDKWGTSNISTNEKGFTFGQLNEIDQIVRVNAVIAEGNKQIINVKLATFKMV